MKTIYNKTIIAAMALASAVSCQGLQDITTPDTPGDGAGKIEFKSVSAPMAAGQQSVVSAGLFAGDPINMYNVRLDINASGQVTPQTPVMWAPGQEKSTDFLAYSPYDETYSSRSEVRFAVKADQSTAEASAASDLLVAQALSKPADGAVALNFEHKLSQISVYFENRTGKDISKVTFASLVDSVVLDLENGYVTAGTSISDIVAYNDLALKCHSVIVPAGTFALDLKITLSDGTVLSRKSNEFTFAAGKSYDNAKDPIVLEDVVAESISVSLSVSDWTYGGNVSFDEWEPPMMTIDVSNITYDSAIVNFIPSDDKAYYLSNTWSKSNYDQNFSSDEDYISYILSYYYDQYGNKYSDYGFSSYEELVLKGLAWQGGRRDNLNLEADTEYMVVSFFIDENVQAISELTKETFRTAAKPSADPDYAALLGIYSFSAYDYFGEASVSGTLVVEEGVVNESYKISIPGIDWCPENGQYIDHFECPWDKTGKKSFSLIQGTMGDMGMSWNYSSLGYCNISLDIFFYDAETAIDAVVLTADANGNLSATAPEVPEGDYLCLQSVIINEEGPTGYAGGILIFDSGMNFTKVATKAVAPAAGNAVQHSVFEMPRLLKKQTFKAHKAIR